MLDFYGQLAHKLQRQFHDFLDEKRTWVTSIWAGVSDPYLRVLLRVLFSSHGAQNDGQHPPGEPSMCQGLIFQMILTY